MILEYGRFPSKGIVGKGTCSRLSDRNREPREKKAEPRQLLKQATDRGPDDTDACSVFIRRSVLGLIIVHRVRRFF